MQTEYGSAGRARSRVALRKRTCPCVHTPLSCLPPARSRAWQAPGPATARRSEESRGAVRGRSTSESVRLPRPRWVGSRWRRWLRRGRTGCGQTDRQEGHHHAPAGGRGESSEHEAEAGVESGGELEPWTGRGGASCDGVACCAVGAGSRRPRLRSGATFSLCRRYRVITARWLPVTSVAFQPGFESQL